MIEDERKAQAEACAGLVIKKIKKILL